MRLFIAEKPELARAIVEGLTGLADLAGLAGHAGVKREDGYCLRKGRETYEEYILRHETDWTPEERKEAV